MTPVALGIGVVMLIAAFDDDKGGDFDAPPAGGSLRIGKGGVPPEYAQLILDAAAACDAGLPPAILAAQLKQESGFNPDAGSPVGAQGISQFMPGTWQTWGVDGNGDGKRDVWDPEDAIPAQGKFMCSLVKKGKAHPQYNGSPIELALAGYNAGWGRVDQYRGVPPESFARGETYNYVKNIMAMSVEMAGPEDAGSAGGWTLPVEAPAGTPYHQRGPMWSSGYHTGIDFVVPIGTPIESIGPGTVVTAGPGGAYGNQVVIRHPDGMFSQYAHLSRLTVSKGQKVKGGTRIGLSGATGNVSGPHLHFEIRTGPDYGSDVSPIPYLRKRGLKI
ncbi:peptidoglycan DD-metalloendopeptidase family protein [Streptomyces marianii]|uniref:Peptidase M23 n=1 Tax=Streptomyces marianii TaxID=1817406 RepID=A0A5R9DTN6_9ACTN|nr:peptidoglycan DD-metalloendopeptidase family protein [Streptomyces marianii]TLQ39027.1 peptidase M23 [Streptomyces marianii]